MAKYSTLLFDMDGTIANTDALVINSWKKLYEKIEPIKRRKDSELIYFSGPPAEESLAKEYPNIENSKIVEIYRDIEKDCYASDVKNYPNCIETITKLKALGFKVGCVTNKPRSMSYITFDVLGMNDLFESLVCCGDKDVLPKPNASAVNKALDELGEKDKNKVIYIGDNEIDYQTAVNSGIDCMLVSWGPRQIPENIKPNYIVNSFDELFEVITNGR